MIATLVLVAAACGQAAPISPSVPASGPRYDVLVVAPRPFWAPLAPWIAHREAQGHRVAMVTPPASAAATDRLIADVAADHPLTHVLLVGRAASGPWGASEDDLPLQTVSEGDRPIPPADRSITRSAREEAARFRPLALTDETERHRSSIPGQAVPGPTVPTTSGTSPTFTVPTFHVRPRVNVHWGGEAHLATDHCYADVTGDGLADVAVGRLPARTAEDVRVFVAKILDYERHGHSVAPTDDHQADLDGRRRLAIVAGMGGFGPLVDGLIETASRQAITTMIPADVDVSVALGNWRSPYCPQPSRFGDVTRESLTQPGLFWAYIGHGHPVRLDTMTVGTTRYPILAETDLASLNQLDLPGGDASARPADVTGGGIVGAGRPIALLLACYTGALDFPTPSVAEQMVSSPRGPIAAFAASRIAMPFAMNVLGQEMIRIQFGDEPSPEGPRGPTVPSGHGTPLAHRTGPPVTLGELVVRGKRRLVDPVADDPTRKTLMTLGRLVSPKPQLLEAELAEHLYLFNLLGDPLLRLPQRQPVDLAVERTRVEAGSDVHVTPTGLASGPVRVEVVCRRDRATTPLAGRTQPPRPGDAIWQAMQGDFEAANARCFASYEQMWSDDRPADSGLLVRLPEHAIGPCHIRVTQVVDGTLRTGTADIVVSARTSDAPSP